MRVGNNPMKLDPVLPGFLRHRVIIPVYIPTLSGYFEHALRVLELCLESVRITTAGRASVTIIANDCAAEVTAALQNAYAQGWIDQLLLNGVNRGKVDAIVSVARGSFEPLITFSDCDVLFRPGWMDAVEDLFAHYPECGIASPAPVPSLTWRHTSSTVLAAFLRRELRFEKVVAEADLDRFAHSIANPQMFTPLHRQTQLVVRRNGTPACVGCGHFVCTIRREVLAGMPKHPAQKAIDGDSDEDWIDRPPDRMGFWRLATPQAFAYHMGNIPEPWMDEELARMADTAVPAQPPAEIAPPRYHWSTWLAARPRRACVRLLRAVTPLASYP